MCRILHENCDRSLAEDKTLPCDSYLVEYLIDGIVAYDIVWCTKRVDIFDMYWDKYRENLKSIQWTDGKVNSKLWSNQNSEKNKKK